MIALPCRAQVVLAAIQSPLLGDTKHATVLVPRLCSCILMAPQHCRHVRGATQASVHHGMAAYMSDSPLTVSIAP